jgi:[ribosomal protein S18]-alanine N-acetyltransferase
MITHLGPGSQIPAWLEELDRATFGEAWGTLDDTEHLWASTHYGFARWRVVEAAQEAELLRIAVDPSLRRGGHGQSLLRHSEAQLARMGVTTLHLEVRVSNTAARLLYEADGWTPQGTRKAYYRDGEDAALYVRELTAPREGSGLW